MADPIVLTDTLHVRDRDGGRVLPLDPDGGRTRVVWRGSAAVPVFAIEDSRDTIWEHLDVVCETPCEAVWISERTRTGPGTIPPTMHQFRDIRVFGNGAARRGFWARPTIDENNEHMRFDCCSFYGCETGWEFQGQQSKEHLLVHCRFESGKIAVRADSSFQWIGGTCAVCECGVFLARAGDPVVIRGVGFEACGCVLVTDGPTTASQPVTLDGVRFEADQLAQDGDAVRLKHAGPLVITGSRFGGGNQRVPRIGLVGVGEQTAVILGNTFGAFGAHRVCPLRAQNPPEARAHWGRNFYTRDEGEARNSESRTTWASRFYR